MDTEVHIGEVSATVSAMEAETLLSPALMRRLVSAVAAELREMNAYETRRAQEHSLAAGVSRANRRVG